jgi:hypothetical protein
MGGVVLIPRRDMRKMLMSLMDDLERFVSRK